MPAEMKHSWSRGNQGLSHRARAFAQFVEHQIER
jgi:XTP/dITP diphosphohydrolase